MADALERLDTQLNYLEHSTTTMVGLEEPDIENLRSVIHQSLKETVTWKQQRIG